jgi:hypothetical protein
MSAINRGRHTYFTSIAVSLALILASSTAWAKTKTCPTKIKRCGCLIKASKVFTVTVALTSSSASIACIDITAPNVVLNLGGNNLTGPGGAVTAAGVHVESSAKNVFIEAKNAKITGFDNGIEDDADGMTFDAGSLNGNSANGMLINGASNSALDDSLANTNGVAGVLIMNGSNDQVHDSDTDSNALYGVEIDGGSANVVQDTNVKSNGTYGIWIRGSSSNRVHDVDATLNANTGIYIGCADTTGPGGACSTPGTGTLNVLEDGPVSGNSVAGIGIDTGDLQTQVGHNNTAGNGTDLVDENASCGTNLWFLNKFTTASQVCIH